MKCMGKIPAYSGHFWEQWNCKRIQCYVQQSPFLSYKTSKSQSAPPPLIQTGICDRGIRTEDSGDGEGAGLGTRFQIITTLYRSSCLLTDVVNEWMWWEPAQIMIYQLKVQLLVDHASLSRAPHNYCVECQLSPWTPNLFIWNIHQSHSKPQVCVKSHVITLKSKEFDRLSSSIKTWP